MKLLIGLSVLQSVAIIVLIAIVANDHSSPAQVQGSGNSSHRELHASIDGISAPTFDEQRLRTIFREVLAAQLNNSAGSTEAEVVVDARTAAKLVEQRERVAHTIESYKGVGPIADQQMQELQDEIAQLDEHDRKQMMSSLIRALNAGAIKGRLQ